VGIRSVHALRGEKLWESLAGADRDVTRRLIVAALNRSHNLPVEGGWMTEPVTFEWARKTLADSTGYLIDHRDGFRTTMIMAPLRDFTYAGLRTDSGEIVSCLMQLPMPMNLLLLPQLLQLLLRQRPMQLLLRHLRLLLRLRQRLLSLRHLRLLLLQLLVPILYFRLPDKVLQILN
jgi:hypothetical protein